MSLPRFVVLKSKPNGKYLRYIHEDVPAHGLLQFTGEEAVSPYAKYEVEPAKSGKGLVHIRCCYNNKYWVRWTQNNWWIAAGAKEQEEDQSKWSCTLFEPVYPAPGDAKTVKFRHVELQRYASLWNVPPHYEFCLYAGLTEPDHDQLGVCTVVDWDTLLVLPKRVAFKGDNGSYLSAHPRPYLQFASSDIGDNTVGNEVFTTSDGSVRIKSDYNGKFWRRSSTWICADTDDTTTNNPDTLFWPIKVDNNVVALRNLGNKLFCKRLTDEDKTNCLNAAISTINKEARMQVEELVISRTIDNVDFRVRDSRIYSKRVKTMATGTAINRTPSSNTVEVKLSYTETMTNTWNTSLSLKVGVKTTITTGIPIIVEGKIEVSAEFTGAYQWGEIRTSTSAVETVYKVAVPPMTIVTVSLRAVECSCDVPFSYSQRDTLIDGQQVVDQFDDGVYTGVNCFDFKYETKQEPLTTM